MYLTFEFLLADKGPSQVLEPRRHTCVQQVRFGATAEDVLTILGAPSRVFYKDEDKMRIHSPQAYRRAPAPFSDYFYNYFTLGLVRFLLQLLCEIDKKKKMYSIYDVLGRAI